MSDEIGRALARALALDTRIWATPDRLRAILMDLCPGKQPHRRVLVAAAEEGIVAALVSPGPGHSSVPASPEIRLLSSRLQARTGIDAAFADWAVRQWQAALGLTSGLDLREPPVSEPPEPRRKALVLGPAPARPTPSAAPVAPPVSPSPPANRSRVVIAPLPRVRRRSGFWIAVAALILLLVGGGFYVQSRPAPTPPESPPPTLPQASVLPAGWWNDPEHLGQLVTTFVGTWNRPDGSRKALFLEIRSISGREGQRFFDYTLNVGGLRFDNLGTLRAGEVLFPDLGSGTVAIDGGRLTLLGKGQPVRGNWELHATAP
ncbi:MAG TPA: hypothetical protein VIA62_00885 [Thermoanaerobaculia bacterium]|jgi:hypothetical protein|nr:hypothetical protein [Thermoanaerobaculia bacterium]